MISRGRHKGELGSYTERLKEALENNPEKVLIKPIYYSPELKMFSTSISNWYFGLYILYKDYMVVDYYNECTEAGTTEFYINKAFIEEDWYDNAEACKTLEWQQILRNYAGAPEEIIAIVEEHEYDGLPY